MFRIVAALLCCACFSESALAALASLDIRSTSPAFGGRTFGDVGAYELIEATAHFRIDPNHPLNAGIVNVRKAPRDADGLIVFDSDVRILKPVDMRKASGRMVYEMVNRGSALIFSMLNDAQGRDLSKPEAAGDGFLMNRGYVVVLGGWQADYPVPNAQAMAVAMASRLSRGALGARLPIAVNDDGSPVTGVTREQWSDNGSAQTFIGYLAYPAANLMQSAKLTVRERVEGPWTTPEDLKWKFLNEWRVEITKSKSNPPTAGAMYDFVYEARDPVVYGLALALMRDTASFLRYEQAPINPVPGMKHAFGFGASQTGRTLKELVYEFNEDERGRVVFDGVHINISGAGKNAVNSMFARPGQKDAQPTPTRLHGDEFPFTYPVTFDPLTRRTDGVLARCSGTRTCPKVVHVDSENELWHGGALTYVDANGRDVAMPDNVRVYALAGTEHSSGATTAGPMCQVRTSAAIDWSPINRALFAALDQWAVNGKSPPPSSYPTLARKELAAPDRASNGFPSIPGIAYSGAVGRRYLLDFSEEPPAALAPYPVLAPRVDADGIMIGGIHHPYVQAPLATHTGWNLRRAGFGEGYLCMASGMRIPFARTRAERTANNDPRLSIEERFADESKYVDAVKRATQGLLKQRLLLKEDASVIITQAAGRYHAAMERESLRN